MLALPRIIGHRGAAAAAPENTLAGIRAARVQGAHWVEVDVKLTRDGVPVLMHDDRLERTTDGRGAVAEVDFADIRRLDAGSWFGPAFAGEPVPTLDELFALCAELGLGLNLEIKPCPGREAETARVAAGRARALWDGRPLLVSSFEEASLVELRRTVPDLPLGVLFEGVPAGWRALATRLSADTLNVDGDLGAAAIRDYVGFGRPVLAWTVNDVAHAHALAALGVHGVFTDRPGEMLAGFGG